MQRIIFYLLIAVFLASTAGCKPGGPIQQVPPQELPTQEEPAQEEPIRIVEITCGQADSIDVHFRISNPAGISSYSLWSTWTGVDRIDEAFSAPLPTSIDKTVTLETGVDETPDRIHTVGLKVILPDQTDPIIIYAEEPGGHCPGN